MSPPRESAEPSGEPDREPIIPNRAAEDSDEPWGDERRERSEDWYREQRPPHHE